MSQDYSPFSLPDPTPPQRPGASRNTLWIVGIVCFTLLVMCGGAVGLGLYAVNQFAKQMAEMADEEGFFEDDGTEMAVEYAIAEDPTIQQRIGDIESVQSNDDLTYHEDAGEDDYYYDIQGSKGDVTIVAELVYDDDRWFSKVELLEGDSIESARTPLQTRPVPFDTHWAGLVHQVFAADDHMIANSLNIGEIKRIVYDYESSDELTPAQDLQFDVTGTSGSVAVVATFGDENFTDIDSIDLLDDQGKKLRQLYSAAEYESSSEEASGNASDAATTSPE